ncbi:MAG: redox-sensing transcriptional repressor Rex, partial [Acidimicrobiia bacterium]
MPRSVIPPATVARLPLYLQCLERLEHSQGTVSSQELAHIAHVNSAKVRKDLSYLGSYGVRGVGYEVDHLAFQIRTELGLMRDWNVVIVGMGNLGSALSNFGGFPERGFRIVGLYDIDRAKIGKKVDGLAIRHISDLPADVEAHNVSIGLITTPAGAAQETLELLSEAGVRSILNFAPAVLSSPDTVELRNVDLSTELQILS